MPRSNTVATILSEINGVTARLGIISGSGATATTNETTGTAFDLQSGGRYVVQADVDIALTVTPLLTTPTDIGAVSADPTQDLIVPAGQPCAICLRPSQSGQPVQAISVAAADGSSDYNARVLLLF